jgi:hypothetical protein
MSALKPDPVQTARLAAILRENAPIHARLGDFAFAETCANVATALEMLLAFTAPQVPPAAPSEPPALPRRRGRLSRHAQVQKAIAWFFDRREAFKGRRPPSEAQDLEDARIECPGVSRAAIRKHRPVEWKLARGERPKSPKT